MAFNPNDSAPSVNQLKGPLIGVVINNQDPLQLRRVQLKIEGVLEGVDKQTAPWFKPKTSGAASRADYGNFDEVPQINSTVMVELPEGNLRTGIYSAMPDTTVDNSQVRLFGEDYPNTSGTCDPNGTWDRKNKTQGYEEHLHQSHFYTQVDKEGNLHVHIPGNVYVHIAGGVSVQVDKDFFMDVLKKMGLHSKEDAGYSSDATMEILSAGDATIEAPHVDIACGTTYDTKETAVATVKKDIPEKVTKRLDEVLELQAAVKKSGEVADDALKTHAGALTGTSTT